MKGSLPGFGLRGPRSVRTGRLNQRGLSEVMLPPPPRKSCMCASILQQYRSPQPLLHHPGHLSTWLSTDIPPPFCEFLPSSWEVVYSLNTRAVPSRSRCALNTVSYAASRVVSHDEWTVDGSSNLMFPRSRLVKRVPADTAPSPIIFQALKRR